MKYNKWTLGLAAVGAVSLASVAQAEEKMLLGSQADLTATTISGYVNTSIHWDFGKNGELANSRGYSYSAGKGDGFNLDVVDINLEKPLDESEWAAGYRAEMWFGPDARVIGSQVAGTADGDVAIKQAFVVLRTPVGTGIDWKVGVFDTIIGYEASNAGDNPNYSRSWGYSMEPTQHTGLLGTYRVDESFTVNAGLANTWNAPINGRDSGKVNGTPGVMGSVAWIAPESAGFLNGGGVYAGIVYGKQSNVNSGQAVRTSYYAGMTVPTPVENLKAGVAFDYLDLNGGTAGLDTSSTWALAGYLSFGMTEKLTLHGRLDYIALGGDGLTAGGDDLFQNANFAAGDDFLSTTVTADYQLWENVVSRLELRWDHDWDNDDHFRSGTSDDEYTLLANVIYKF